MTITPRQADNPPLQVQGGARERATTLNATQKPRGQDHDIKRGMGTMGPIPREGSYFYYLTFAEEDPIVSTVVWQEFGSRRN